MSALEKMAAAAASPVGKVSSPANLPSKRVTEATRIPMSLPKQQLEVPEIPGYVMQWFADRPGLISRARAAGYEFVGQDEVMVNNFGLAADVLQTGNTDLGNQISIHGGTNESGGSERLYLMKIRQEWWEKDQKVIADRNEAVAAAIRGGELGVGEGGETRADFGKRYVKRQADNLFTRKDKRR